MKGVIYGLSCSCHQETGIRYVGLTTKTAPRRLGQHVANARHGYKNAVHYWIRKHGAENIRTETLEEVGVDMDALNDAEVRWIARLRSEGADLLNRTDGGGGTRGLPSSPAQRAAMRERAKGRVIPAEEIARRIATRDGYTHSPETREKMRLARLTRTHCLRNHEFTPENTKLNHKGARLCRECIAIRRQREKDKRLRRLQLAA